MKDNVTLVLSGGGARGFAHIGVIEELESNGFVINSVAGTSMGALVGGVYASGRLNEFKKWACTLDKLEVLRLVDFSFSRQGLVKGDKVLKKMKEIIPDMNIGEMKVRYTATAFDLSHNKEVVFREGSLFNAIRASISIPTVFTPVISGNTVLVDGGVVNNIPISNAVRSENDMLIAVNVNADIPLFKPYISKSERESRQNAYIKKIEEFKNHIFNSGAREHKNKLTYFNLISETLNAMTNHMTASILQNTPPDLLIEISKRSCGIYDFYKVEELIEIGRHAARKSLG